jgi:hypothetical protein
MPVVLAPRHISRPQIRPQTGVAVPRGGLGPRAETVTSWIRAAGLSTQIRPCYTTVAAAGKKAKDIAARLVCEVVKPLVADLPKLTQALDDTPTQRHGPFVQGAGIHHNPTPGPAGPPHVYGHIWAVLGLLAVHPALGVSALPLSLESTFDLQGRQSSLQIFDSSIGDLSAGEADEAKLGQPFQLRQPGVGDLSAVDVEVCEIGEPLQMD